MMGNKFLVGAIVLGSLSLSAQDQFGGQLHGNFQLDGQWYLRDENIDPTGEFYPDERFLGQGYANFVYTDGDFSAGLRYENYQNVMLGFPEGYRGEGITYRFLRFKQDNLDITVGSFYEQFGSGMVFRSYEERGLGYDNAMDGVRIKANPAKGVYLKGVLGRQRFYFEKSPGVVRGFDTEINLTERSQKLADKNITWTLGGSFISKYQRGNDPFLVLPENVATGGFRTQLIKGAWAFDAEWAYKANDPSADNGYIYKDGNGFITHLSYSKNGLGLILGGQAHRQHELPQRPQRNHYRHADQLLEPNGPSSYLRPTRPLPICHSNQWRRRHTTRSKLPLKTRLQTRWQIRHITQRKLQPRAKY